MEDGILRGEFFIHGELKHSQTIKPMVVSLLQSIGREAGDADVFAVSCGPGSFTGLRIGVGAVKGVAMALGKPCAPISTLQALALNMQGRCGYIVPAMDARANQVYTAIFQSANGSLTRVCEDMAVLTDKLYEMLAPYSGKPIVLVGDGAQLCRDVFAAKGLAVEIAPETLLHQRAASVCVAAAQIAQDGGLVDAVALEPIYLRLPQAERERQEREGDARLEKTE